MAVQAWIVKPSTHDYVHYPDLPHGFIQLTAHSARCLEATQELAGLLGDALTKAERDPANEHGADHDAGPQSAEGV
jgi:hypothetical protein